MRFCTNCGNQLPDDVKFCGKCGTPVQSSNETPTESVVMSQEHSGEPTVEDSVTVTNTPQSTVSPEIPNTINEGPVAQPKAIPWVWLGIGAIVLSVLAWIVKSTVATIVIAIGAIALAIFLLVKKAKPKALPIVAIVISGILLIAWCVQWTVFDREDDKEVTYQKVTFRDLEFTIPNYYELGESSNSDMDVYNAGKGKKFAFLDIGYGDAYNDGGATAAQLSSYSFLLEDYQDEIDAYVDQGLDEAIKAGISGINGYNVEYVKDLYLAGTKAKEYRCTCDYEGYTVNTLMVGSIDIMTGDFYYIILGESTEAGNKYLSEFDGIVASAKYIDETRHNDSVAKSNSQKSSNNNQSASGVSPDFKETMDSYEEFFNEYIDFMKKYTDEGSSANAFSMLADYSEFMTKYADMMTKMSEIDTSNLSPADSAYYLEVTARIYQKLAELQ